MGIRPNTSQEPCAPARLSNSYNINKSINPIIMKKSLLMKTMLLLCALIVGSTSSWADTTVSYGWEDSDDATTWDITAAIEKTKDQGNTGSYAGKINTNNTYVQFKTKVYVKSFSFAFKRTSNNNNYNVYIETSTDGTNWTAAETYAMSSFTNGSYTTKTKTFDGNTQCYVRFHCNNTTATRYVDDISITYSDSPSAPTCAAPTFSPAEGFYTSAQNVTISTTTEGATIYYTTNGDAPTTSSNVYSGAINVSSTTTIKAMAVKANYDNSAVASATYTISEHAGTQADPYTVADARLAIDASTGVTGVYVTGIVCEGGSSLNDGAMNYWISDDGTETNKFEIYKGKGLNGANFTSTDDVKVGDVVVVTGNIKKYSSTYEFDAGSQLVSLDRPVVPIILANNVTIEDDATSGEIAYTIDNPTTAELQAATTADWISNIAVTAEKVTFTATANTGAQRTATITLSYTGATDKTVTVTQKKCTYGSLPFAFDGGKSDVANTLGLSHSGLGSDYSSSPKLKFDDADDYVILHVNEVPGSLSFVIKGNSFSGGTFKVQTSADGETYTDLKEYTALDAAQTESFALANTVRYIKWVYTEKDNGNVALGNISLVVNAAEVTVSAAGLATFASNDKLDFTNVENLEAYIAKENAGAITLAKVNKVPAGTGVLLRALNSATDFKVPVTTATADAITGNLFVRGAGAAVASQDGGYYNYVLGKHNDKVGFYKAGGMTVATDKAYIQTTIAAARILFDFDNETTSINEVSTTNLTNNTNEYFNLAGQRVAQPTKGLYIVNGKKYVIK